MILLRQADLLAKRFHPRIAADQVQFWKCQSPSDPNGAQLSHSIQSVKCPILVAQTGIDQNLLERTGRNGRELLCFRAASGAPVCIAEIPRIGRGGEDLNRFLDSALANANAGEALDGCCGLPTADLFVVLIMKLLKPGGRTGLVLPDGTLIGEGVKTWIKETLPKRM